jgi:hypothetical protein
MDQPTTIFLSERAATELWHGDAVILGGGLCGLAAALALRARKPAWRILIVEAEASLAREVTLEWRNQPIPGAVGAALARHAAPLGARADAPADPVITALAADALAAEAKIELLLKVLPMRAICSASGMLRGVEVVGKSGRQLISAPLLVDATPGRSFSRRQAELAPLSYASVQRVAYVHGVAITAPQNIALPASWGLIDDDATLLPSCWSQDALLSIALPFDGQDSAGDLMRRSLKILNDAVAELRRQGGVYADASLVDIASQFSFHGATACSDNCQQLAELALCGIYCLPLSDDMAEDLASASQVALALRPARVPMPCAQTLPCETLQSDELQADVDQDLPGSILPPLPVSCHPGTEIVVAGWGAAGIYAAISAAEKGAEVSVLDPCGIPGGLCTAGRIHSYYYGLSGGRQDALDEQCGQRAKELANAWGGFHPMAKAQLFHDALSDSGKVTLHTGHLVFGVIKDGARVCALLSAAEDGYHLFPCQAAIDSSGDGDVAAAAGASSSLGRPGDRFPQPYSYTPSRVQNGKISHHNFDVGWTDPCDSREFSRAHLVGRRAIARHAPFTEERHYCTLSPLLGLRESRFILGRSNMTFDDVLDGRQWDDAVCSSRSNYDNHAMDYAEESNWAWRYVMLCGLWDYPVTGQVPFGAMLPAEVDGLLVACRALAVDHDLSQMIRMQHDMHLIGEVCGVAAAMALQDGVMMADVDLADLRTELAARGVAPHPAVKSADLPLPELLAALAVADDAEQAVRQLRNLAIWRLGAYRGSMGSFWPQFFADCPESARFPAAVAAAMGGHDLPEVRAILQQVLASRQAAPLFGRKAPMPYLTAALALAELPSAPAAEPLCALLDEWSPQRHPKAGGSATRPEDALFPADLLALLKALAKVSDRDTAARGIRAFLAKWPKEPFAMPLWGVQWQQPWDSFRFAIELRAARTLICLGDQEVMPLLLPYLNDDSLLVRRYARNILRELRDDKAKEP